MRIRLHPRWHPLQQRHVRRRHADCSQRTRGGVAARPAGSEKQLRIGREKQADFMWGDG